ncbi:MAG TPA: hypothetical protein VH763_01190 [Gemmatimonadales bacterium]|jgi:hypothetical protein
MKHSRFGLILLLAAAGGWACNSDPTDSFRETNEKIVTDPAVVFLDQGANTFVTAQLVDEQGNQLAADFQISDVGSGISVVLDTTFLATTNGAQVSTTKRFIVTATDPVSTTFTLTANGQTLNVPVSVIPTGVAATFSNPTPAANEPVILTAPAGYTFLTGAVVLFGADTAIVVGRSDDSTALTLLPSPGTHNSATIDGISVNYLPGTPLNLTTVDSVNVAAVTPLAGTNSAASAPPLSVPAIDGPATTFFDGGTFDGTANIDFGPPFGVQAIPARFYTITIPADEALTVTINWTSPEDLGGYFFLADGTTETGAPADAGGGGAHPETSTNTLTAGTYKLAVVNFSATNPAFFSIQLASAAPPSP